jgi:hypothetical protein
MHRSIKEFIEKRSKRQDYDVIKATLDKTVAEKILMMSTIIG